MARWGCPEMITNCTGRATGVLFERADRRDHPGMVGVIAVAHIDAKGIGARPVQFLAIISGFALAGPSVARTRTLRWRGVKL